MIMINKDTAALIKNYLIFKMSSKDILWYVLKFSTKLTLSKCHHKSDNIKIYFDWNLIRPVAFTIYR